MKKAVPLYKVLSDETKNAKKNCPMYKSILEFIEKGTTKIEKITKESLLSGNMMCFEEELFDTVLEFERSLYQEILESIE